MESTEGQHGHLHLDRSFGGGMAHLYRVALFQLAALLGLALFATGSHATLYATTSSSWGSTDGLYCSSSTALAAAPCLVARVDGTTTSNLNNCAVIEIVSATQNTVQCNRIDVGAPRNATAWLVTQTTCPANSAAIGSTCVCNTGFSESTQATCVASYLADLDALNNLPDPRVWVEGGSPGLHFCKNGVDYYGTFSAATYDGKQHIVVGPFSSDGVACAPTPTTTPSSSTTCPTGQYPGVVNGVSVCSPSSSTNSVQAIKTSSSTTPGAGLSPDAPSTAVTSSSSTSCTQANCTTTTTYRDGSGSVVGTKSASEDKTTFCQENPKSMMCLQSSFSAACGFPPVCTGDAVFCAIASSDFTTKCALNPDPSQESSLYGSEKSRTGDQTAGLPGNNSVGISAGSFNQSNSLGVAAAGMSDLSITVMGRPVVLEFSRVNPWLSNLGAVLMAVTFLLCIRIVTRG